MRSSVTHVLVGTAIGFAVPAAAISGISTAIAGSTVEATPLPREVLINRYERPRLETDSRLEDYQQLRTLFLGH
jgi:hypothetical protein